MYPLETKDVDRLDIIESSVGPVQIGIPPETIKTSMKKGGKDE